MNFNDSGSVTYYAKQVLFKLVLKFDHFSSFHHLNTSFATHTLHPCPKTTTTIAKLMHNATVAPILTLSAEKYAKKFSGAVIINNCLVSGYFVGDLEKF